MILDQVLFKHLLDKGERILKVAHVHPFIVYPRLAKVVFVGLVVPAAAYFLFPPLYVIWLTWGGLGVLLFFYRLCQWYLDAWVITNASIIDHQWESPFTNSTNRIEYGNIDGVTNEIIGFWGTILRFGNLQITHTSGKTLVLESVANPRKIERFILEHQQSFVREQSFDDHSKLKDLLTKMLRDTHKSG